MDAVVAYGQVLTDDPGRFGDVEAIGLDETLRAKTGRWKTQQWSTQIVDVGAGQLLDVVQGRNSAGPCEWFAQQPQAWLDQIRWRHWTCRARTGWCSTRCCPTRPRSPISCGEGAPRGAVCSGEGEHHHLEPPPARTSRHRLQRAPASPFARSAATRRGRRTLTGTASDHHRTPNRQMRQPHQRAPTRSLTRGDRAPRQTPPRSRRARDRGARHTPRTPESTCRTLR